MSIFNKIRMRFNEKKQLKAENEMLRAQNIRSQEELKQAQAQNLDLQATVTQLRSNLDSAENEVTRLTEQCDVAVHNAKCKLIKRINELGEMDMEKLRAVECSFDVYASSEIEDPYDFGEDTEEATEEAKTEKAAEPVKWAVVTAYCQYGGCDLCTWFDDERSARIYAILRTENGFPSGLGLCNTCRREYYENCM